MNGVIVMDKPTGQSSARALDPLRALGKVGHAGTLDPFASGVLLVLTGDATRLSALAMELPKRYAAQICFGRETDTLDPQGRVVAEADPGAAPPPGLAAALQTLTGEILQAPPAYSALKVGGRRAYRLARAGQPPTLAPRRVSVFSLSIARCAWPQVDLEIVCGSGTYVRCLARDLGRALGLPASLSALRRTAIGPFRDVDADPGRCLPCLALTQAAGLGRLELDADRARRFVTGQSLPLSADEPARVAVVWNGELVGLGENSKGILRPLRVLAGARHRIESLRFRSMKSLLFVCIENSCRSQMAEALARMRGADAASAGSRPCGHIHPGAIRALRELGYDMRAHRSKSVDEFAGRCFDAVVTMGCGEACPTVPGARHVDWEIADPKCMDEEGFRTVRDQIGRAIDALLRELR